MTSHLEDYLTYYKNTKAPGYAVLVAGEWGVGKTFQVKRCLRPEERYYVSLFGLQSVAEVHSAVLAEVDPTLAKVKQFLSGAEEKAATAGHWLGALGGWAASAAGAMLRKEAAMERTLVFDDLERSNLELKDKLGVINTYVEQHGARVVVLAHDAKIAGSFVEMKEKLIGQTIRVEPRLEEAFEAFCGEFVRGGEGLVVTHRPRVLEAFRTSGAQSLRVLRHVVEDLTRLQGALEADHMAHDAAMAELVPLFTAFDVEVRVGGLNQESLRNPMHPDRIAANKKYAAIDLHSKLLQEDALVEMLIYGRYDSALIRSSMNESQYFLKAEAPPWRLVMSFDSMPDETVHEAAKRMREQFDKREIVDSGEMLHVFSLLMMMAEEGIIGKSLEEAANACMTYVDDLLTSGRLPPRETDWLWYESFSQSHGGYQYWVTDQTRPHFQAVSRRLIEAREEVLARRLPELARPLMELMKTDGRRFLEEVCSTVNGKNTYAMVPVLAAIPPEEFVETWLSSDNANWRPIGLALKARYEPRRLRDELRAERDWAGRVVELLDREAARLEGFRALRIRRAVPPDLRRHIEELDERDTPAA